MNVSLSRKRRGRFALATAAAASAALLLSACSGGVAGGGNSGGEDGVIKLGMLAPFSGSEAAFGDYMKYGAQLAIDEINADGGVNGSKLKLVTEDDACDATAATAAANKLVSAGVKASVGGYCSGSTLPTVPIFKDAKIPMVIPAANSTKLLDQGAFLINGTGTQQGATAVKYAKRIGAKSVVLVDDNTDYSVDLAKAFETQADGLSVAKRESVNPDEKDFAANVNSIKAKNPDFIYWTGYYQAGGLLIKQLRDAGYDGTILVGDGSVDAKLADIAGEDAMKNVFGTFTRTPDMLEGGEKWVSAYKKLAKAEPGPYSMQTYEAVKVVAEAMTKAKGTDGDKVVKQLQGLKDFPLLSGELTFAKDGSRDGGGFVIVAPTGEKGAFELSDELD